MTIKIPKNEIVWTSYYNADGILKYVTTSKNIRDTYYLYEVDGENYTKLCQSQNPALLEDKMDLR